jgi:hypothetical protein
MNKFWIALPILLGGVLFIGNFHVFTGSRGTHLVPRVTFALSEFFVNEDALRSMPGVILATQFPLSSMALKAHDDREIEAARKIANP